jgi:hypothetical protein
MIAAPKSNYSQSGKTNHKEEPRRRRLGGEAVYHYDPLAEGRIEACERRAGVIKRDAPSDQFPERQFSCRNHVEKFRISMRLHAVAAEDFQFMRDDSSHRDRRLCLISEEQSDLHVAAAPAEREDRISTGDRAAERVNGDVNPALREIANGLRDVVDSGRIKRVRGPGLPGEGEFLVRNIDADDVRPERARNHHRRKADTATSVHRDPLAGSQPRLLRDAAKRRRKAAAERSGIDEFHLVGKAHQVEIGEW